jgi:hypothetical protein
MRDIDEIMAAEAAEQELLQKAVSAADRIICEGCDGDNDVLMLLTAKVALAFTGKVQMMAQAAVTRKEFLR